MFDKVLTIAVVMILVFMLFTSGLKIGSFVATKRIHQKWMEQECQIVKTINSIHAADGSLISETTEWSYQCEDDD